MQLLPVSLFPASSRGAALSRHSGLGLIAHSPSSTPRPIRAMRSRNRVFAGSLVYGRGYDAGSIVLTEKDAYEIFTAYKGLPGYYVPFQALTHCRIPSRWSGSAFKTSGRLGRTCNVPTATLSAGPLRFLLRIGSSRLLRWFRWLQICARWILATRRSHGRHP